MDKYYQLLDANSANVSSLWKVTHVASMLFATISGFIAAYTLGKAIDAFDNRCILFAHIVFLENTTLPDNMNKELPDYFHGINMPRTDWGTTTQCYFCQFTPVMSMISGLIWGAFFFVCSKGGAGYISDSFYRPWRIVYPAIVFSIIATGFLLLSTLQLSSGIKKFCAQFKDVFNTAECTNYIDEYTLLFSDTQKPLIILLRASHIASIICLVSWIAQLISLILRVVCVADFEMFKISVTFPNDSEESLQIIEPDNVSTLDDNISNSSKPSITSKKSDYKNKFQKFLPKSFFEKMYRFKRSSSASYDEDYNMDRDDDISLNEPNTSSKDDIDKKSTTEAKTLTFSDLISIASHDKEAKRIDTEKQAMNTFLGDTIYSSLFFGKKEKYAKKMEDTVMGQSVSFVPHSTESILSNVLYSHPTQNNSSTVGNQIKIDNSGLNQSLPDPLIPQTLSNSTNENESFVPNYSLNNINNHNENIGSSSPTLILDYPSIDFTNRYQSFGFAQPALPLHNDMQNINSVEQRTEGDVEIVLGKNINLPIQLIDYDLRQYASHRENMDEVIISVTDRMSNENFVISRNRTAAMPNYEYTSNSRSQYGHVNLIPVNEGIIIPETDHRSLPILNYTENAHQQVVITPPNETIDSNNYIHDSNTILGLTRNKHRTGYSQNGPYTLQGNAEGTEEISPREFREEHIYETNPAEDSQNEIRNLFIRIYLALWLTVVLRNISTLA